MTGAGAECLTGPSGLLFPRTTRVPIIPLGAHPQHDFQQDLLRAHSLAENTFMDLCTPGTQHIDTSAFKKVASKLGEFGAPVFDAMFHAGGGGDTSQLWSVAFAAARCVFCSCRILAGITVAGISIPLLGASHLPVHGKPRVLLEDGH